MSDLEKISDLERRIKLLLDELASITSYARYSMEKEGHPNWVEFEDKILAAENVIRVYDPTREGLPDLTPCGVCGWINGLHNQTIHDEKGKL